MLPKIHRLKLKGGLNNLKKESIVIQGKYFGLLLKKSNQINKAQFAIIVSKKITKKAVERNKIKRRISEAIRELSTQVLDGGQVVFLVKKPAVLASGDQLKKSIIETFLKANLIKGTATTQKK